MEEKMARNVVHKGPDRYAMAEHHAGSLKCLLIQTFQQRKSRHANRDQFLQNVFAMARICSCILDVQLLLKFLQSGGIIASNSQSAIRENTFVIAHMDEDFFDGPLSLCAA